MSNQNNTLSLTVSSTFHKTRLDKFCAEHMPEFSRERIKKAITDGTVLINGTPCTNASQSLKLGQTVQITMELEPTAAIAEEGHLSILFQDDFIAILDKPANLTVHPCPSQPEGTLVNRLVHHLPQLAQLEGLRPGIVHRLDKDTSGLLLVALQEQTRIQLAEQFAERAVFKEYLALIQGIPNKKNGEPLEKGEITTPIGRHPTQKTKMGINPAGRDAKSTWNILYSNPEKNYSLAAIQIETGRTHQIRVHMASIGHAVIGDATYGPRKVLHKEIAALQNMEDSSKQEPEQTVIEIPFAEPSFHKPYTSPKRQMLHAWQLQFTHPETQEKLSFSNLPPEDFFQSLLYLEHTPEKIILTGNAGCGKSTVLQQFKDMGISCISADAIVQELYEPEGHGWHLLAMRYGTRFTPDPKKPVDKQALFEAMKSDPRLRGEIEHLIHPLVQAYITEFFTSPKLQKEALLIAEVPLYFEAHWHNKANNLTPVCIYCPADKRRERLLQRGWTEDMINTIESWQWNDEQKAKASAYVIDNQGEKELLPQKTASFLALLQEKKLETDQLFLASINQLLAERQQAFTDTTG